MSAILAGSMYQLLTKVRGDSALHQALESERASARPCETV